MNIDSNPMKILFYKDRLDAIANGCVPSPIMIEIDPVNYCNFNCHWCCSSKYNNIRKPEVLSLYKFYMILKFIREMKTVLGIYWCGGGEPTLNKTLPEFMREIYLERIRNYITTNGSTLTNNFITESLIKYCDWIGVSINSGSERTWRKVCGSKLDYNEFLKGLEKLNNLRRCENRKIETNYKFVFDPTSYVDIVKAYHLAVKLGFTKILLKPADLSYNKNMAEWSNDEKSRLKDLLAEINCQRQYKEIEIDCAEFYGLFDSDLNKKRTYRTCWTACLSPVFSADGKIYVCCVRRGERVIGRWDTGRLSEWWGSSGHIGEVFGFDPNKECPVRCKCNRYNEIFQKMFVEKDFSRGSI